MVNVLLNVQKVNTKKPLTTLVKFVTQLVKNVMDQNMTNVSFVMVNYTYTKENVLTAQMVTLQKNLPTYVNLVILVVKPVLHSDLHHVLMLNYPGI